MFLCKYNVGQILQLLMYTLLTSLLIYKETLLLSSTIWLIFTIFSWTKANFPSFDTVHMFGLSHSTLKNKSPLNFFKA